MDKRVSRNHFTMLLLAVPLAACAVPGKYSESRTLRDDCPDGGTFVDVKYGDSYLEVDPKANVKRNAALEFRLKPKSGYEDKEVVIEGKTGNDAWIAAKGTDSGARGKLTICVPPAQPLGTYHYYVRVEDIGTLDPRADVTR